MSSRVFNPDRKDTHWGSSRETNNCLIYVDTSKQVGDEAHLRMFANPEGRGSLVQPIRPKALRSNMRLCKPYRAVP
jgi:hypothetical protein